MSKDTVYRQDAIDALRYAQHRFTVADEAGGMGTVKWSEDVIYFAAAENVLSFLPSAEPERKRGKWVSDEDGNIYCSVCGRTGVGESFCEHCGANMKGEEE